MKKFPIAILFSLILTLFFVRVTPSAAQQGPKIFIPEPSFDFGEVKEGAVLEHSFTIKNKGEKPLHIRAVRPG